MEELQKELLKLAASKADYTEVADESERLRELRQNAMTEAAERDSYKKRIDEMMKYLKEQDEDIEN